MKLVINLFAAFTVIFAVAFLATNNDKHLSAMTVFIIATGLLSIFSADSEGKR